MHAGEGVHYCTLAFQVKFAHVSVCLSARVCACLYLCVRIGQCVFLFTRACNARAFRHAARSVAVEIYEMACRRTLHLFSGACT